MSSRRNFILRKVLVVVMHDCHGILSSKMVSWRLIKSEMYSLMMHDDPPPQERASVIYLYLSLSVCVSLLYFTLNSTLLFSLLTLHYYTFDILLPLSQASGVTTPIQAAGVQCTLKKDTDSKR